MIISGPSEHQSCHSCHKNGELIKKYQKLIRLYQKKQLKLSMNGSSCLTNNRSTNHTEDTPRLSQNYTKFVEVFQQIIRKRYSYFFRPLFPKSSKKFLILSITNRLAKFSKRKAFKRLKEINLSVQYQQKALLQSNSGNLDNRIQNESENSVIQKLCKEGMLRPQEVINKIKSSLGQLHLKAVIENRGKNKSSGRRVMELQIENKKLKLENQMLKNCLEQIEKRQLKENQKKRQTLEELAAEMSQKNEEINHLKQTIKSYEENESLFNKVLEHDTISLKKDVQILQKLNERLNNDLQKIKDQLMQSNKKLKNQETSNKKLSEEIMHLHNQNYSLSLKNSQVERLSLQYTQLTQSLLSKIKRINIYERKLQNTCKGFSQLKVVTEEYKSQIILLYLANISDPSYCLHSIQLFDEDERKFLEQHKQTWRKFEAHLIQNPQLEKRGQSLELFDVSEIQMKDKSETYLNPFEASNVYNHNNKYEGERGHDNLERQGITMKLLEMQIQSKKQVGKITQLKQKLMHIRVIILKLLKSLQISIEVKTQAKDILRVLFDLFEYSEDERESIFVKKKKLFGFI